MRKFDKEFRKLSPTVKNVLLILGAGAFLSPYTILPDISKGPEDKEWKKFNKSRLNQILKRLYKQKLVEITYQNGNPIVTISKEGRKKILAYQLEEMQLTNKKWDGKWRIITYDVGEARRKARDLFRKTLKQMNFYRLQKSVYLTPYDCVNEIEYLRHVCGIGIEVAMLTVSGLENEKPYKEYFGL